LAGLCTINWGNSVVTLTKKDKENNTTDSILLVFVLIYFLKNTIDLFVVDLLPELADNIFWVFISLLFIIIFLLNKKYIYSAIMISILLVGLVNF
jgi:hypothetical protein